MIIKTPKANPDHIKTLGQYIFAKGQELKSVIKLKTIRIYILLSLRPKMGNHTALIT